MKRFPLLMTMLALCFPLMAQLSFRNTGPTEYDSQGHKIEKLDYDRKIVATNGLPTAKEFREELAERERMKKVAAKVGPWFDAIQRLEIDQKEAEKKHDKDGGGLAGDGVKGPVTGQTGIGMLAYIEAMRVFNSNTSEGGSVSRDARQLKAALDELLYRRGGEVLCGPSRGVSIKYPLELLLVRYQSWKAQHLDMDELYPAKSADLWPGKVPADAQRVRKTVVLYPGQGGWLSTGLYVPPGEVVTVHCSSLSGRLTARIGCHSDRLDPKICPLDENGKPMDNPYDPVAPNLAKVRMGWEKITDNRPLWRWPDMVRSFSITKKRQEIGHVLGGVLWFQWSGGKRPLKIEVTGCVQMPWFRLGLDSNEDWNSRISKYPAPWAEIQTKTIILTVESKHVRHVRDMVALAQWWGKAASVMLRVSGRGLPTDSEADNYRAVKREWGILNKELVRMDPETPPDNEEHAREERAAAKKAAIAAAQGGAPAKPEENTAGRYAFEQEELVVPKGTPTAIKKPYLENEPKMQPMRIVDDTQISVGAGHSGYPIMCIHWGRGMCSLEGLQRSGNWGALHEIGHNMGQGTNGVFALPGNVEVVNNFFGTCTMNMLNHTPFPKIMPQAWNAVANKIAGGTPDLWTKAAVFERLVFYMAIAHRFGVESVVKIARADLNKVPANAVGDRLCCAWSRAVQRDMTPYFEMWGLPLSKAAYTFTQDWVPWPSAEEKAQLFRIKLEGYDDADEGPIDTTCPEHMKTRRQLRDRPTLKKSPKAL